jgi:hypothetical protein
MENGLFIDDFPIKTSIYKGFSMAMLNNQMVFLTEILLLNCSTPSLLWGYGPTCRYLFSNISSGTSIYTMVSPVCPVIHQLPGIVILE